MEQKILEWGRKNIRRFLRKSDTFIYEAICDNFYIRDFEEARECSIILFKECNKVGDKNDEKGN